jgi:hypothetical protein
LTKPALTRPLTNEGKISISVVRDCIAKNLTSLLKSVKGSL